MKKIIISLLIIITIILIGWLLKDLTIQENYATNTRFKEIERQYTLDGFLAVIYYDKITKIQYIYSNKGGFELLVDRDGKPLLYGEE